MDKIETGVFEQTYFTVTTNGKIADVERYDTIADTES